MSFRSFTKKEEDVTVLDMLLTGVDVTCETMEASMMMSCILVLDDNDAEDGFDEDGLEAAAAMC